MAWIKATHDLPDKSEVVAMATKLGIDQDAVVGKLLRVWIWFDRETTNGVTSGVTSSVTDRIAFCPGFGKAMEEVGWIVFHRDGSASLPYFDDHHSESAKARAVTAKRVDRHRRKQGGERYGTVTPSVTGTVTKSVTSDTDSEVSVSDSTKRSDCATTSIGETTPGPSDLLISGEDLARAEPLIASLFKRSRYKGDDGEFFWRVGVLASVGAIPEALVQSACNGAAQNSRRNAVGFARKALTEACAKIGIDLKAMLTAMKMPRLKHRGAPKPKVSELATSLGDALAGGH